ncbi:serine hydrolase [Sandaracinobacter neustonicus]|uniref:Serine hydrolase n=1 Tax=Sandaracinobacter neustonicus TaxID=1715348 RepID=A0A501XE56_9SPHN|nr:serine hydrolase [Sandaracinobacter neustonicus]TPE58749.1 serine hydrolase [Sandaracinobacter neustonicus]
MLNRWLPSFALLLAAPAAAVPLGGIEVPAYGLVAQGQARAPLRIAEGAAEFAPDGRVLRPFTVDNPVRIASISKVVVALALHRLADAGRIDLDADVSRYLGWTLRNPAHPEVPISIRQMMRHESSLSDAGGYFFPLGQRLRDHVGAASFSAAAPGTAFDYANLNQALLGEVIEQVTGQRFDEAVQALVLEPLGIDACYNWSGCSAAKVRAGAAIYRKAASDEGPWDANGPWIAQIDAKRPPDACEVRIADGAACDLSTYVVGSNGSLFSPQGGLRISLADLSKLGLALLKDDGFLKPDTRASLFRAVRVKPAGGGEETDAGLMQYWSEGGLHCFSGIGEPGTDQPLSPQPLKGCGHLGDAYGLKSGLVIDPVAGTSLSWAFTGVSAPPPPGRNSHFSAPEEALVARAANWLSTQNSTVR